MQQIMTELELFSMCKHNDLCAVQALSSEIMHIINVIAFYKENWQIDT